MSRFKKIDPEYRFAQNGNSSGFSVDTVENVDGREIFVTKSSKDVYPELASPDMFTLENQLKSGVPLKDVPFPEVEPDYDRLNSQFEDLTNRVTDLENQAKQNVEQLKD